MSVPRNNTESNEPRSAETPDVTQPRDKQLEQPKTRNFDDYLAKTYAKHPGLELEVEIAGILIDVQMDYYKRIKKGQDTVGGFEKQQQQIKVLIAQASHTAVVEGRIDEVRKLHKYRTVMLAHSDYTWGNDTIKKGGTLAAIPLMHLNERIAELRAQLSTEATK